MEEYSRERHEAGGYEFVNSPHITKADLFHTSGHLDWYADGMFPPMHVDDVGGAEGVDYYLKPMNCPFHILIYRSRTRSYRELPLRLFEFGSVYRYEKSGVVHGLTRVRGMTQDDAHIFTTKEQMVEEIRSLLDFVLDLLRDYGLDDFYLELSTKPEEKVVGTDEEWDEATEALRVAASGKDLDLVMDPGGGAFYGPKISVQARDAIGRTWQMSTIQLDFQPPQRFDIHYIGADNERHRPIMIHRALFGSIERFFAVLLEHYAGAFPLWLAPVQATVLPVADRHDAYAFRVVDRLKPQGFRAEMVDGAHGALGERIRRAKMEKVPYILVVGDDDAEHGTVGVNKRGTDDPERGRRARRIRRASRGRGRRTRMSAQSMSLERLWAGWRGTYIVRARHRPADPAIACSAAIIATDDDEAALVLERTEHTIAVMNLYPYGSGHLMVAPVRHVGSIEELSDDETTALDACAQRRAVRAIRATYEPDGINVGANLGRAAGAGVPDHAARARAAPLGGRHQLHDVGRRGARPARAAQRELPQAAQAAWPAD